MHAFLSGLDPELSADMSIQTWQIGPQQWQSDLGGTCLPLGMSHAGSAALLQSIVALHCLPPTDPPASIEVLSCIKSLCGVLGYISALVSIPDCLVDVPNDVLAGLFDSLHRMKGAVHGYAVPKGRTLLEALKEQAPKAAFEAEQQKQAAQYSELIRGIESLLVSVA